MKYPFYLMLFILWKMFVDSCYLCNQRHRQYWFYYYVSYNVYSALINKKMSEFLFLLSETTTVTIMVIILMCVNGLSFPLILSKTYEPINRAICIIPQHNNTISMHTLTDFHNGLFYNIYTFFLGIVLIQLLLSNVISLSSYVTLLSNMLLIYFIKFFIY